MWVFIYQKNECFWVWYNAENKSIFNNLLCFDSYLFKNNGLIVYTIGMYSKYLGKNIYMYKVGIWKKSSKAARLPVSMYYNAHSAIIYECIKNTY